MLEWMNIDADYYIWMDSSFNIISNNIGEFVENSIGEYDICLFKHPWYNSIKKETDEVINGLSGGNSYLINRYEGESIKEQYLSYINDVTFIDDKLFACGLFI